MIIAPAARPRSLKCPLGACRQRLHAAAQLRVAPKRLWRRIEHYVEVARARDVMTGIEVVGIDETSVKRGQQNVTVVHDLEANACCS